LGRARELGLSVLVEVHNAEELDIAFKVGASLIGINNRDLKSLKVSLETSFELMKGLSPESGRSFVSESGISDPAQVSRLREAGFSGILVGTSLMKYPDPGLALKKLLAGEAR
jgi:indole-3-glycerol phosphate synthase